MLEKLRSIYGIAPKGMDFKNTTENARPEFGVASSMFFLNFHSTRRDLVHTTFLQKTRHACVVEAKESARTRIGRPTDRPTEAQVIKAQWWVKK